MCSNSLKGLSPIRVNFIIDRQIQQGYWSFKPFKDVDRYFQNGTGSMAPLTLLGVDPEVKAW